MLKHEQVYHALCELIQQTLSRSGNALPTESALCSSYGVSRQTLRKALSKLKQEHVIEPRQGSGIYLTGILPEQINQILMLVEDPEVYTTPLLISKISGHFSEKHFQVSVIATHGERAAEGEILQKLVPTPPRGLFVQCTAGAVPTPYAGLYRSLEQAGTKIVFLGERYPNLTIGTAAAADDRQGAFDMTMHLLEQGHTSAACILLWDSVSGQEKYLGFSQAMLSRGIRLAEEQICWISRKDMNRIRTDRSHALLRKLMNAFPGTVTAILCQNDELAFHVMRYLREPGGALPANICIAGFDNSYLLETGNVNILTMETDAPGEYACHLMDQLLHGEMPSQEKLRYKMIGTG